MGLPGDAFTTYNPALNVRSKPKFPNLLMPAENGKHDLPLY